MADAVVFVWMARFGLYVPAHGTFSPCARSACARCRMLLFPLCSLRVFRRLALLSVPNIKFSMKALDAMNGRKSVID